MSMEFRAASAPRLLSLLVASLLSAGVMAQTTTTDTSAAALGLSDYRHFVIYPHLEKALKAQKANDEKTALGEFEYIHQQAPDNVPLTLYLAEAYRHFGRNDQARELLTGAIKSHPGDARLQTTLDAIPVKVIPVRTVEDLLAQQKRCDAEPTPRCRSEVGQNAIRLNRLDIALAQLNAADFTAQPQAQELRTNILQRAIYLKQWQIADTLFSQQKTLSAAEQQQWFDILLAGRMDDRILALQAQGRFNSVDNQLTYAGELARRGEKARLQRYLAQRPPEFQTAEQEKRWLYLLSRYSENPQQALASYQARFSENRRYLVGATLPEALKDRDYAKARSLLDAMPANEMLDERYAVSLATHDTPETLRLARQLYARDPSSLQRLDQLTWQLMQAGQSREAATLLMQRYPFGGNSAQSQALITRLSGLLQAHPEWATPAELARLAQPLASPSQRQLQSQLPGVSGDCRQVRRLLGDMSASYDAGAWSLLANCERSDLPGVALYAFQQAQARQPNAFHQRAVAYQAYQVEDYATALQAWKSVRLTEMNNDDLLAAATTAQAAGDGAARDGWLDEAQKRGLDNSAAYWRLHAQRYLATQPAQALADYTRALDLAPTADLFISRAAVYRQLGNTQGAISDLRQALALEPDNSTTQAALGYALWDDGEYAQSREALEKAHKTLPDDPAITRQLVYVNERLGDIPQTQRYAQQVIDDIDNGAQVEPLTPELNQQRYDFRRLHEDIGRRWTFNVDTSIGLNSGAVSSPATHAGGGAPGQNYRSFAQMEAEYRLGRNMLLDGDLLSVYSRLFADTGGSSVALPVKNPMLGAGLRWKPFHDYTFFLAIEQQVPLDRGHGESDTMLRASASFLNDGKYSDEWHPNGSGWFAQNLYLDAAQYVRQDIQAWTADYRVSWHQKVAQGQTIEPYAHVQTNGYRDGKTQGSQVGGLGVRWNIWTGESHYDAWPHKVSLGLEYQHTFNSINQEIDKRNNAFFTVGVHW
ncbi:Tetratricopeptide TPR_1 repeat-containing protein [[Enterobacter] lignolyticus SCF1]|uniref:Tetratricopeptide TPR_1 repeat-containing protein n=2 Tax=[Enterobacter] lignolyticus TaxID=1334193 RepID=E3G1I9_ENTLS|nr:Tetratricopeptide TPR_1 repeat-containing protein [[Enterobacter] lignolyticus SCF1]